VRYVRSLRVIQRHWNWYQSNVNQDHRRCHPSLDRVDVQGGPNWTGPAYIFACDDWTHLSN